MPPVKQVYTPAAWELCAHKAPLDSPYQANLVNQTLSLRPTLCTEFGLSPQAYVYSVVGGKLQLGKPKL